MDAQVIIVGAGVSGLIAAQQLYRKNIPTIVLDKGRSVGGRMATRRVGEKGVADHGAQFFTVRTPEFQEQVEQWMTLGLVSVWGHGWSDGSLKRTAGDGHPRYINSLGMNTLTQMMAQGLDVRVNVEVSAIQWNGVNWLVKYGDGAVLTAAHLILTPPVPQSLKLLDNGHVQLAQTDRAALEKIEYGPCLCGIYTVKGDVNLPDPGAVQDFTKTVYWIADNQRKGISKERVITLHTEARYSKQHYDAPETEAFALFDEALAPYLASNATITERQLKKWRYSIPLITHPHDILKAEGLPLTFAGDAFGGRGRVEGAFISGLNAGQSL
jgi:hypothetical protein